MPKGEKTTKKQHYIPQVYLRGFSPEYGKEHIDNSKYTIYCYDLLNKIQNTKAVPIKSICYEKNLYEVTGKNGEYVMKNRLEGFFSKVEEQFKEYRDLLEKYAFITDNYNRKNVIRRQEAEFWVTYLLIQLLRIPQVLKEAEEIALETFGKRMNKNQAHNFARLNVLPFFKEFKEGSIETQVFESFFELMKDMVLAIGVDKEARIITSDKPVYIKAKEDSINELELIIFPITERLCLFMVERNEKSNEKERAFFCIDEDVRKDILYYMTLSSFEKLYSNHILDETEEKIIQDVKKRK